jgi:hypothetical protein
MLADESTLLGPRFCRETRQALAERPAWSKVGFSDSRAPAHFARRMLWIDGVGAYLVCAAERVVLGRAFSPGRVDVPILAPLSPKHANIRRQGDVYLVEPAAESEGEVKLDGKLLRGAAVLRDGMELTLRGAGEAGLRFSQPHPWSASARLDFTSRHTTAPRCDGILLLADTLILGPGQASSVRCPKWERDVLLVRQIDRLGVSHAGRYEVDGKAVEGAAALGERSRVRGQGWSFAVEGLEQTVRQAATYCSVRT